MIKLRQLKYDEVGNMIRSFKQEQSEIEALQKTLKNKVGELHNNQWVGEGADKFFEEMERDVLPAIQRLSSALGFAAQKTQEISDAIRRHDEECKSFFAHLVG